MEFVVHLLIVAPQPMSGPTLSDNGVAQLALPLLAGIVAWFANEWRKRAVDERQRREERYRQLLDALSAFYVGVDDPAKKTAFFNEVTLCWFCPDSVIQAAYDFLDQAQKGGGTPAEAQDALNKLVLAMRKDLWNLRPFRRTKLLSSDVKHYRINA